MAPLEKVAPGQPVKIPAATWNAFIDAAKAYQDSQHDVAGGPLGSASGASGTILIQNKTTSARNRFDILALSDPIILPADNQAGFEKRVAIKGIVPTDTTPPGAFAILTQPLAVNAVGQAQIVGVCPAKVNFSTDKDTRADIRTGYIQLWGGTTGPCEVLWKETGTGLKYAVIRLGSPATDSTFLARITGPFVPPADGTYGFATVALDPNGNLYSGNPGDKPAKEINGLKNLAQGSVVWMHKLPDADGDAVYLFDGAGLLGGCTTPYVMLPSTSGWEPNVWYDGQSPEAESSDDSWQLGRAAAPGTDGSVSLTVQTRTAYNPAGDQTLYAFYRNLVFDSTGRLVWISWERRVVVTRPEGC